MAKSKGVCTLVIHAASYRKRNFRFKNTSKMERKQLLSREEMKNVKGGGTCAFSCNGFYGSQTYSQAAAQAQANDNVTSGRCSTATWCCTHCPVT